MNSKFAKVLLATAVWLPLAGCGKTESAPDVPAVEAGTEADDAAQGSGTTGETPAADGSSSKDPAAAE